MEIRVKDITMEEGCTEAVIRISRIFDGTDGESKNIQTGSNFINKKLPKVFLSDRYQCFGKVNVFKDIKKYMEVKAINKYASSEENCLMDVNCGANNV